MWTDPATLALVGVVGLLVAATATATTLLLYPPVARRFYRRGLVKGRTTRPAPQKTLAAPARPAPVLVPLPKRPPAPLFTPHPDTGRHHVVFDHAGTQDTRRMPPVRRTQETS